MASQAAEIAALKILLVGLYAHVAGQEGSPEKAQALLDRMKRATSVQLEAARSRNPVPASIMIDDVLQNTHDFFDSITFIPGQKS